MLGYFKQNNYLKFFMILDFPLLAVKKSESLERFETLFSMKVQIRNLAVFIV